jgi:hypothetical protein
MVFPANLATLDAFAKTSATDTGGLIVVDADFMKYVRWVKPHKIRVLRTVIEDHNTQPFDREREEYENRQQRGGQTKAQESPAKITR